MEFAGSTALAIRRIAKFLKLTEDDLVERMQTKTNRQRDREIREQT